MKRLADQTFYEILEVPPGASAEQIQAAYEKARALYGPGSLVTYTLMEPDEAALLESRIEDARTTLLDPERRARYDEDLQQPQEARAAAGGAAAASPVVPAAQASAPARPAPEPAPARPAVLLGAALESAGPAGEEPPPPRPILLLHQVSPEAADVAPLAGSDSAAEPPALAAPTPTSTSTPTPTPAPAPTPAAPAVVPPAPEPAAAAPPPPAPPLPDAWTGDTLRQVRESRGLSIQQIADRTKVTRHHIENIEADRFASLPAQVYLRGILLTIARELRLDGQKVARSYIERLPPGTGSAAASKAR